MEAAVLNHHFELDEHTSRQFSIYHRQSWPMNRAFFMHRGKGTTTRPTHRSRQRQDSGMGFQGFA